MIRKKIFLFESVSFISEIARQKKVEKQPFY